MMPYVSEPKTAPPSEFKTPLQELVYSTLKELQIPFERVETDEVITMEDCAQVNHRLNMKMVKTLFLCNQKQTEFYLFITAGGKPFKSKEFSGAMGISRVSFAPIDVMERMLGTKMGAATVFSALTDTGSALNIVFDRDVVSEEWYGCSDGTTTGYMKIKTEYVVKDFLRYANHEPAIIQL